MGVDRALVTGKRARIIRLSTLESLESCALLVAKGPAEREKSSMQSLEPLLKVPSHMHNSAGWRSKPLLR